MMKELRIKLWVFVYWRKNEKIQTLVGTLGNLETQIFQNWFYKQSNDWHKYTWISHEGIHAFGQLHFTIMFHTMHVCFYNISFYMEYLITQYKYIKFIQWFV